jgi:pimeloyl-ACP methyl ester carboxylesterase
VNINVKNIIVNYQVYGDGIPVVFLHGWGVNGTIFTNLVKRFNNSNYKIIVPDLPGFGLSVDPNKVWNVDDYADWVVDFVKALGLENQEIFLLGHSFGGRISIKLASRYENTLKIKALILTGAAGVHAKVRHKFKFKTFVYRQLKFLSKVSLIKKLFPYLEGQLARYFASVDYKNASPIMRECLIKAVNENLEPCLEKINCDTLLLWGKNDDATPLADGELMAEKILKAKLVVLEKSGHFAFRTQEEEFFNELNQFLESNL